MQLIWNYSFDHNRNENQFPFFFRLNSLTELKPTYIIIYCFDKKFVKSFSLFCQWQRKKEELNQKSLGDTEPFKKNVEKNVKKKKKENKTKMICVCDFKKKNDLLYRRQLFVSIDRFVRMKNMRHWLTSYKYIYTLVLTLSRSVVCVCRYINANPFDKETMCQSQTNRKNT